MRSRPRRYRRILSIFAANLIVLAGVLGLVAVPAHADTVLKGTTLDATVYRGGDPKYGGFHIQLAILYAVNSDGKIVHASGYARLAKVGNVRQVAVTEVALGDSTSALVINSMPVRTSAGQVVVSKTDWRTPDSHCAALRVRANIEVEWSNGIFFTGSYLSGFGQACFAT
jgi:hypothetical protein